MAVYRPAIQLQLQTGCDLGSVSCTPYSGAMAGDRATLGKTVPKGCTVRHQTGDTQGGTTLTQVANVLDKYYNISLPRAYYISISEMEDLSLEGRGIVLDGGYGPVRDSPQSASETFSGNHAIFLNEYDPAGRRWFVYDPLADGRRPGIAKGPDWWPESLVRKFAAALVVNPGSGRTVGDGRVWCAYTKVTHAVTPAPPSPSDYGVNPMVNASGVLSATPTGMVGTRKIALKKGQTIYKESRVGSPGITKMSASVSVPYLGNAGKGFKAVLVSTGAPYSDNVLRPTIGYVTSGVIE